MRNTGYAIGRIDCQTGSFKPEELNCIRTENVKGDKFFRLEAETLQAQQIIQKLKLKCSEYNAKIVIVEMPDFSQNAKSAMLIGMLWGSVFNLGTGSHYLETIEPTALKEWSESTKGDGKDKVTAKVLATIPNFPQKLSRNNNITDAAGIALLTAQIARNEFETYKKSSNR